MNRKWMNLTALVGIGLVGLIAGCPNGVLPVDKCADVTCADGEKCVDGECVAVGPQPSDPQEYTDAKAVRGGALYDKWWVVAGVDAPENDHPRWEARPDMETNERMGADTWRCKECHGWDYKGVNGAYATGSHVTGFAGILGTTKTPQELFDLIKTGHGFGDAGLTDTDVWDLAKFAGTGQIDTGDIMDADGVFTGDAAAGQATYDSTCAGCHGPEGLAIPPTGPDDFDAFVGFLASDNPAEFQHKVRFGQPGTGMPAQAEILTTAEVADLAAYAQTLPVEP